MAGNKKQKQPGPKVVPISAGRKHEMKTVQEALADITKRAKKFGFVSLTIVAEQANNNVYFYRTPNSNRFEIAAQYMRQALFILDDE